MMPVRRDGVAADDEAARPRLEVVAVEWERIQLQMRLRLTEPAPQRGTLCLRRTGEPISDLESRRPTRDVPAGERGARFNMFCGPDQMPLEPGRWDLVLRSDDGTDRADRVPVAADFHGQWLVRDFPWYETTYRVAVDVAGGTLALRISVHRPSWLARSRSPRVILHRLREMRRRAWVSAFDLLVRAIGRLPRRRRLLVFTSDSRSDLGGNLKLVHDRLIERGVDRKWQIRTIFKPSIRTRRGPVDRARLVWLLARADFILLDDYQPAIYRLPQRPDRQRIIQLWHAWGAFKTVGYSRLGKPGGPNPWSRVHKNYTFATVSSTHEEPFYAEAFGIPDERVVGTGTPRMDDFLDPEKQRVRHAAASELLPAARGREVVLFAPTFRGRSARGAEYPVELIDVAALHAVCEERDAYAVIRMHPFVRQRVAIPTSMRDRILDASDLDLDTNDLLLISDLLVTDYSSLIFEFSSLGRPMLFFAYDLEEYTASRDFYEPYESFVPGRIVRTFDEVIDAIRNGDVDHEKVEPFARRHLPAEPGSATDRIIDALILGARP